MIINALRHHLEHNADQALPTEEGRLSLVTQDSVRAVHISVSYENGKSLILLKPLKEAGLT